MTRCRFCGAAREDAAAPCPACGERSAPEVGRWWQSNATVLLALALLGPFALPLVWAHPRYKVSTKVALTIMVVAVTVWATLATRDLIQRLTRLLDRLHNPG